MSYITEGNKSPTKEGGIGSPIKRGFEIDRSVVSSYFKFDRRTEELKSDEVNTQKSHSHQVKD